MFRLAKSSKRGFTLLETMLAVALLLIVTLMAYEGFMATLNYAGDTALADRVSNSNAGEAYKTMGSKTGSGYAVGTGSQAIMVSGPSYKSVFQVESYSHEGGMSIFSSGSSLTDEDAFLTTTNRHGFNYLARECPTHHTALGYFIEHDDSDNEILVGKCQTTGCDYELQVS
jgi:prepilin-type N-terminal cleavage/methylation domain-containing protein